MVSASRSRDASTATPDSADVERNHGAILVGEAHTHVYDDGASRIESSANASHRHSHIEQDGLDTHADDTHSLVAVAQPQALQPSKEPVSKAVDIEHEHVEDDPRSWSPAFKWTLVAILCAGALIPTMAANIFFPAINDVKIDLHATDSQIALSISLFILAQGILPLLWSPVSELIGRKPCFLAATGIFTVCMAILGGATKNVATLIAMRVVAAGGSSALLAISAGTLADLYEPAERGVKVGIYYCSPLLGPAFAPIFGGLLTDAGADPGQPGIAGWRLTFIFMAACGAASFLSYCFLRETFRVERSFAWQKARREALEKARARHTSPQSNVPSKNARGPWSIVTSFMTGCQKGRKQASHTSNEVQFGTSSSPTYIDASRLEKGGGGVAQPNADGNALSRRATTRHSISRVAFEGGEAVQFRPRLADVSPLGSAIAVCKQPHNLIALFYSGLAFGSQYSLTYTATRTFTAAPYNYSPIDIGLVLLSLGGGGVIGSVLGGRLSDRALRRESERLNTEHNDGEIRRAAAEFRIKSVRIAMLICPPSFVGYAWSADKKTNIAAPIVCLFVLGFSLFWIYSSTLSYIVDSNTGRSTGAVACNSAIRGLLAFAASEVAGPIQDAVGDGPLYTGWAVILAVGQIGLLIVAYKGEQWRQPDWKWPRFRRGAKRQRATLENKTRSM